MEIVRSAVDHRPASIPRPMPADRVDVWLLDLKPRAVDLGRLWTILDRHERRRTARLCRRDARRFVVAHATVRAILSSYVGADPRAIRLGTNDLGRPEVDPGGLCGVDFNVAHCEDLALCALSRIGSVGVDIERTNQVMAIGPDVWWALSDQERQQIESLPLHDAQAAMRRCWTRKEALVKCVNRTGHSPMPGDCTVPIGLFAAPARLNLVPPATSEPSTWSILDIPVPAGFAAALATDLEAPDVRLKTLGAP